MAQRDVSMVALTTDPLIAQSERWTRCGSFWKGCQRLCVDQVATHICFGSVFFWDCDQSDLDWSRRQKTFATECFNNSVILGWTIAEGWTHFNNEVVSTCVSIWVKFASLHIEQKSFRKTLWKKVKLLKWAISPFSAMFSMQSVSQNPLIATFQLSSAASLNLGRSQNVY